MKTLTRVLLLFVVSITLPTFGLEPSDDALETLDDEPALTKPSPPPKPTLTIAAPAKSPDKRWYVIIPAFVVHGIDPSGGANQYMPRRMTADGRFVSTPGLGLEFQGHRGFEMALAFVKDCYDNPAGAIQVGQHWRVGTGWDVGYSFGLYVRKTPILCMTSKVTTTMQGRRGQPTRTNTLTSTRCAFQDNLPLRYTTRAGGGYMDIIPTPFLHASARVYHGAFDIYVKAISNFYLNEFGLSIPF